jgi:hypothetical protein
MRALRGQPLLSFATRIFSDTSGASATLVAIALPALIGFGALGAETGAWFTIKLRTQSAADAAAISAAYAVIAGTELLPAASEAAAHNGYTGTTAALVYPYSDAVLTDGLAVTLQQPVIASLAVMFLPSVTVATKAVTVIEMLDNSCILALGATNTGIGVAGGVQLNMAGCSGVANSISSNAIALSDGSSSIIAATLVTAGEISLGGEPVDPGAAPPELALASPAMIGAPAVADPYAATLTHAALITGMPSTPRCKSRVSSRVRVYQGNCKIAGTSLTHAEIALSANTQISGAWDIATGQTVDLAPGAYWVTGGLTVQSGAVLKCSTCDNALGIGVTIILTAQSGTVGALLVGADATINLNAPQSGAFPGLVIVQDSNDLPRGTTLTSSPSTIGGASGTTLNGLVYFPRSSISFHGNPSVTGPACLLLVVNAVEVDASSTLSTAGCGSAGLANLPTVSTVALAE